MAASPFDAIVIGSGQAGPFLAVRLAQAGQRVALVEREHLGGTCVNDGCIPTKALVASARAAHVARRAADWGVRIGGPVEVDLRAVQARRQGIVQASLDGLAKWIGSTEGLTLVWGEARFAGPDRVEVNGQTLQAPRIFVNVGGRPVLPDWPGIDHVPVLTNTTMMTLDTLPGHLLIAGGSYIGLEFAQMFRRFGARVTVLETAGRLIAREDPEISTEVQAILEREGIDFRLQARVAGVEPGPGGGVRLRMAGGEVLEGSHLLAATGRRPNTDTLALERAGLVPDARGFIPVDAQLRTAVPGIWALGDCNGRGAFTHTSYHDHEVVAANLLDSEARSVDERITAYALFIDPPLGRCGMTEAQVRERGRKALVATLPMSRVGRARERGETQGFMKVLVDAADGQILGASLLGIEGDEVVHVLLDAMIAGMPWQTLRRAVHIHPTVSELIPTLLSELKPLA